jgi:hypothetical protein
MKQFRMKKQTALDWLEQQMKNWGDLPRWQRDEIIEQAKEMEKEQRKEAYRNGYANGQKDAFTQ